MVDFSINGVIVTRDAAGILHVCLATDAIYQSCIITINVERTSSKRYQGIVGGILEEEARNCIDAVGFC